MRDFFSAFSSSLGPLDWSLVALYLAISISIGFFFKNRAGKGLKEYFVSGRKLPWWLIGTSMVATTFAVDTPLAVTGWIRSEGIWKNWFWWNYLISHVLIIFVFSRLWRRAEVLTDNELVEMRYSGKPAAFLRGFKAFYFSTIFNFIVMGWVISAMAKVMAVFFGFDTTLAIVLCLVIALVYTMAGGLWGVVLTDLFQYTIALIGTVVLVSVVVGSNEIGGIAAFWSKIEGLGDHVSFFMTPESGIPVSDGFWDSSFFAFLIYTTVIWWSSHNSDGGGYMVQRLSSAKNEKHATAGMAWFVFNHYVVRLWPWVIVAVCSLLVFPLGSESVTDNESVYVVMVDRFLGPGLKGLLFVTFLSAFMSTVTTQLNWGASYLVNDIYKRFMKPNASDAHYIFISRAATFFLCLIAGYTAFQIKDIGKAWIFLWAMSAGIGLVLVLRWFWWRVNAWSEISALGASLFAMAVLLIYTYSTDTEMTLKHQILVVPFSIAVWLTVTFMTKPEPLDKLKAFYVKIRPWGWWEPVDRVCPEVQKPRLRGVLTLWGLGVGAIFFSMVGIGKIVLGEMRIGVTFVSISILCAVLIWKMLKGEFT